VNAVQKLSVKKFKIAKISLSQGLCYLFTVFMAIFTDQVVKQLAKGLEGQPAMPFIPGIVELVYQENTGAGFSMLSGQTTLLIVLSIVAAVMVLAVLLSGWITSPLGRWSLVWVFAGAVGNLVDRIALGYVVDMFRLTFVRFAIFNVADMFITVGGILFCCQFLADDITALIKKKKSADVNSEADEKHADTENEGER